MRGRGVSSKEAEAALAKDGPSLLDAVVYNRVITDAPS